MRIILLQFTNKILYFTDRELKEITTSRRDEHNPNAVQCPIRMDNPAPLQLVRMVSIFDRFQSWKKIDTLRQISSRGAARPAYPVQSFIGWRGCRKSERNFPPILSCCSSSASGCGFFSFVLTAGVSFLLSGFICSETKKRGSRILRSLERNRYVLV